MSRRRRTSDATGSLDLFLDTICNAFGGIMFVCILLSLLVQMQGDAIESDESQAVISSMTSAEVEEEIARLKAEREELLTTLATVKSRMTNFNQAELEAEVATLQTLRQQFGNMVEANALSANQLRSLQISNEKILDELETLTERIANGQALIEQLSEKVENEAKRREFKSSLPRIKTTSKRNIIFAVRQSRIYQVTTAEGRYNKQHVQVTEGLLGDTIQPIPNSGWLVEKGFELLEVQQSLESSSPRDYFITVAAWSDSFDAFGEFKKVLISLGYEYDLHPIEGTDAITIGEGVGSRRVQ